MGLRYGIVFAVGCLFIAAVGIPATAADESGWSHDAEVSWVAVGGNAKSTTIGLADTSARRWENALLMLKIGGLRAETTNISYENNGGPPGPAAVSKVETSALNAENYYFNGRYDRNISPKFFWFAGAGWLRNEFAGIENRYSAFGGVGNIWYDREKMKFRTDYGLSYTDQTNVIEVPGVDSSFVGIRFSSNFKKIWGNTTYINELDLNSNFEETSAWYGNMLNSVAVSMTEKLALKVSLLWQYNNEPAFTVTDAGSGPPVPVQLEKLDSIFTTSLVVSF